MVYIMIAILIPLGLLINLYRGLLAFLHINSGEDLCSSWEWVLFGISNIVALLVIWPAKDGHC